MSNVIDCISHLRIARIYWLFLFMFLLPVTYINAGTNGAYKKDFNPKLENGFCYFEENKGQFKQSTDESSESALFVGKERNTIVLFFKNKLVFQFSSPSSANISESGAEPVGTLQSYTNTLELVIENASADVEIKAEDPLSFYKNYYYANTSITGLHPFQRLIYQGIYPGIDMVVTSAESGIKYSFLVHPGANPSVINLRWHGTMPEQNSVTAGLLYKFPLGTINEAQPVSYTESGAKVNSRFLVKDNKVGFKIGAYNNTEMLTIDPVLKWSTYYGGSMGNPASIVSDINGNILVAGFTSSNKNIATSLAFQSSIGGTAGTDYDAFVANFNSSGSLVWATYYGGQQNDFAKKVVSDNNGNVWFCGYTQSISSISTIGAYQQNRAIGKSGATNFDAFLVKLNPSGYRLWGTYFGGNGDDMAQGLALDNAGNAYMSGITYSDSGITTSSAFQMVYDPSGSNAFIARFNNSGSLLWASYYGRSDNEVKVACDGTGSLYITGTGGASPSTGAFQTKSGGAFLARFSSSGARLWGTYYGGGTNDIPHDICTDYKNNVIFAGVTGSSSNIASPGVCFNLYNGEEKSPGDGFIAKFDSSGGRIWSEYFGGAQNDAINGVTVDSLGNIYGTGFTRSKTNIATPDAYQSTYSGASGSTLGDAFIAKFAPSGSLQWSTYYGGTNDDAGLAIAMDKKANLYIAGSTTSSTGIAYGSSSRSTYSGSGDGFILKFNTPFCSFTPAVSCVNKVCPGSTFGYSATYHLKDKYNWAGTGGTIVSGQYTDTVMVKWDTTGIGIIKVIETGQFGCKDSISLYVTKFHLPKANLHGAVNVCSGAVETYTAFNDTTYSYRWLVQGGVIQTQPQNNNIDVKWGNSGKGYIKLIVSNASGCVDSLVDSITIYPKPRIKVYPSGKVCRSSLISLGSSPVFGYVYNWNSIPGGFSTDDPNPQVKVASDVKYFLNVTDTTTGCTNNDSVVLSVKPKPYPKAQGSNTVCSGSMVYYYTKPTLGNTYYWKVSNGKFISRTNTSQCQIEWDSVGSGSVIVYETNSYGCTDSSVINVKINATPTKLITQDRSICYGSSTILGADKVAGHTYNWHSVPNGFSSSFSSVTVKPLVFTTYYLVEQDSLTGCAITDSMHIALYQRAANLKIKGNTIACNSALMTYESQLDSGFNSKWGIENGKIISGQGTNTIKVIWDSTKSGSIELYKVNAAGCKDSINKDINILAAPRAFAGISESICQGQSTQLGENGHKEFSYSWVNGATGAVISSVSNPIVTPPNDTKYILKVTNTTTGCSKTDSVQINVLALPNVTISGNASYCVGEQASFSVKKAPGNTYKWKAEGGTIISGAGSERITVLWDKANYYGYIRSIVVNAGGCLDSMTLPVKVNPLPDTTIIGKANVCQKGIYVYTAQQARGFYTWKIEGGYIISGQNTASITVQWTSLSIGKVTLQVMNTAGCATFGFMSVQIEGIPTPLITGQAVICQNFNSHYEVQDIAGHSYNWIVNGGTIISGKDGHAIDVHWDQAGQGGINVEESSSSGCKANAIFNVKVNPVPVPDFTADPVCEGQIMAFINHTANGFKYNWEFGDGSNSNDENAFHKYTQAGSYIVHLNVFSIDGCTQSLQKNVKVIKTPTALFDVRKVCQGTASYFQNKCQNSNGYAWDFGDGKTSVDSAAVHTYPRPGVYHVTLTAFAQSGCNSSITLDAIVNPGPDASILINRDKNVYQFAAKDSSETYFQWDFGDGNKSDKLFSSHEYKAEGMYRVHLNVINGFDCVASNDTMVDFKYMLCAPMVYPNPFKEVMNISYCLSFRSHLKMVLIDQLGQPVKVFDNEQDAGTYNSSINTADLGLHSGAFVMQLWVNDNLYSQKLIHFR